MDIEVELLPHQRKFLESKERYSFMVIGRGGQELVSFRSRPVRAS